MAEAVKWMGNATNDLLKGIGMGVPDAPEMEDVKEAPDPNDKLRQAASEKEIKRKVTASGRTSTIMSGSDKLG